MFCTVLATIVNVLFTAILREILSYCILLSNTGEPNHGQAHRPSTYFLNFLVGGPSSPRPLLPCLLFLSSLFDCEVLKASVTFHCPHHPVFLQMCRIDVFRFALDGVLKAFIVLLLSGTLTFAPPPPLQSPLGSSRVSAVFQSPGDEDHQTILVVVQVLDINVLREFQLPRGFRLIDIILSKLRI